MPESLIEMGCCTLGMAQLAAGHPRAEHPNSTVSPSSKQSSSLPNPTPSTGIRWQRLHPHLAEQKHTQIQVHPRSEAVNLDESTWPREACPAHCVYCQEAGTLLLLRHHTRFQLHLAHWLSLCQAPVRRCAAEQTLDNVALSSRQLHHARAQAGTPVPMCTYTVTAQSVTARVTLVDSMQQPMPPGVGGSTLHSCCRT